MGLRENGKSVAILAFLAVSMTGGMFGCEKPQAGGFDPRIDGIAAVLSTEVDLGILDVRSMRRGGGAMTPAPTPAGRGPAVSPDPATPTPAEPPTPPTEAPPPPNPPILE